MQYGLIYSDTRFLSLKIKSTQFTNVLRIKILKNTLYIT